MQPAYRFLSAAALALLSSTSSMAAVVYTSSALFLGQIEPGFYTESFDGLPTIPPTAFASGGFAYTVSAPSDIYGSGEFLGTSQIDEALTVTFTSGNVKAVGGNFFASDIGDAFQSVLLTITLSDGTVVSFTPGSVSDSYRGFTSDVTLMSLVISGPGQSLYAGLDNLTVGTTVPEPTSAMLVGLGLAGLLVGARRRGV